MKKMHILFTFVLPLFLHLELGSGGGVVGGIDDYRGNADIESIGRFAVQQHNSDKNADLEFERIIKAREQVVSGKMYYLTLQVSDAGKKEMYEAKVWVKPWLNMKKLEEFKHLKQLLPFPN